MIKLVEAQPLSGYKLWLKFEDGTAGVVDLSRLAGKGVFEAWKEYGNFKIVSIHNGRWLEWAGEIDIDADSLYLKLTGKKPEDLFPALKEDPNYA
jgi:hypothetical protein